MTGHCISSCRFNRFIHIFSLFIISFPCRWSWSLENIPSSHDYSFVPFPPLTEVFSELEHYTYDAIKKNTMPESKGSHLTPSWQNKIISRRRFPEKEPLVCLAFLSCCGRTDLLEKTLLAAVEHMERDEPDVPYEIAWVDNGSGQELTANIFGDSARKIEHVHLNEENRGLASGLNKLLFDLCTAPYVLILEEDWLYMDAMVAPQTLMRRSAVKRAIEVAQSGSVAFDGRLVMGAFLRPETYDSFLKAPHVGPWERTAGGTEFRVYCGDPYGSGSAWGSYTNGAGLYSRAALKEIGRFFGEPGDIFHESYSEANYAFRASMKYCHALIRLEDDCPDSGGGCNAAFYHIGGGRGTRPNKNRDVVEADESWVLYGTPAYEVARASAEQRRAQVAARPQNWAADEAKRFQAATTAKNAEIAKEEAQMRERMRVEASHLRARSEVIGAEASVAAAELEARADSAHPLPGFWDAMGHPLDGGSHIAQNNQPPSPENVYVSKPREDLDSPKEGSDRKKKSSSKRRGKDKTRKAEKDDASKSSQKNTKESKEAKESKDYKDDKKPERPSPERLRAKAEALRSEARVLRQMGPAVARQAVATFKDLSDEQILGIALQAERVASDEEALVRAVLFDDQLKSSQTSTTVQDSHPMKPNPKPVSRADNKVIDKVTVSAKSDREVKKSATSDLKNVKVTNSKDVSETTGEKPETRFHNEAERLRRQAQMLRQIGPAAARAAVAQFRDMSDEQILKVAQDAEDLAANQDALAQMLHTRVDGIEQAGKETSTLASSNAQGIKIVPNNPTNIGQTSSSTHADAWRQAVFEYERNGHRAFTGAAYQAQFSAVKEALQSISSQQSNHILSSQKFLRILNKAVYGPGASETFSYARLFKDFDELLSALVSA